MLISCFCEIKPFTKKYSNHWKDKYFGKKNGFDFKISIQYTMQRLLATTAYLEHENVTQLHQWI